MYVGILVFVDRRQAQRRLFLGKKRLDFHLLLFSLMMTVLGTWGRQALDKGVWSLESSWSKAQ